MQAKRKLLTIVFSVLAILSVLVMAPIMTAQAATQPTITPIGVNPGEQVQLRIENLPADTDFKVTMSAVGHQGVGPVVANFNSNTGGTRTYWFEILNSVDKENKVEVRIDSGTGIFAYATFDNTKALTSTTTTPTATSTTTTTTPTTTGTPAPETVERPPKMGEIHVVHVQKGGIVVAELKGMPLDTKFTVSVGTGGSEGLDGFKVGNLSTESLSDHIGSFEIPVDLSGERSLDLRIEAPGYLYLVTFANTSF